MQFFEYSDVSILACKWQRAKGNTHFFVLCFYAFTNHCDSPYPFSILLFLSLTFQSLHLSISSHLPTTSLPLLLSVMTHWACPNCGVPSICKHGILWAEAKKMAATGQELVGCRALFPIKEKDLERRQNWHFLQLWQFEMLKTFI